MSQENLAVALAIVDAVARMDEAALVELTDPDVEWHSFRDPEVALGSVGLAE